MATHAIGYLQCYAQPSKHLYNIYTMLVQRRRHNMGIWLYARVNYNQTLSSHFIKKSILLHTKYIVL